MRETHDVAILGASGYTGAELVRLIATHPSLRVRAKRARGSSSTDSPGSVKT